MPKSEALKISDVPKRFWKNVYQTNNCWLWTGLQSHGYGRFKIAGKMVPAHVYSFRLNRGDIPEGKNVLHVCDIPQCVRPDHLFLGSDLDNARDKISKGVQPTRRVFQTHCIHGHEFTATNTYIRPNGTRACKECLRERASKRP